MILKYADLALQVIYIGAIICVLLAKFYPKLNVLLKYGKTLQSIEGSDRGDDQNSRIVTTLLNIYVPKYWFFHFYVISFSLSAVFFALLHWGLKSQDAWFVKFFSENSYGSIPPSISRLAYFLLMVHSFRRLMENLFIFRFSSKSKMHISHYLVGVFFYSAVNINVIINTSLGKDDLQSEPELDYKIFIPLFLFLIGFGDQFLNHFHLSKTIKYNLPNFGMFKLICCAHYFDEILIYSSVYLLLWNSTSLISLIWVAVNLAVSSIETRNYYKINNDGKIPKWSIVPFVI